ncbi:hypothetical protein PTSG_02352 [Salpingoeca rosetta]|uniref:Glycosyltransferase 2-like domain-containing protein n=1 Tax=Salpingoeca rosetta (strain ATCC 50818 / BSB-021) TaxID=946362 RepID=F2U1Y4_SALR5|nr:uncharacterized protein PTSG_02352 [Salpingoeca rosetta]EGD81636.1 hypothetical protein PTSG_02352 [Salpingoeca rosetta]|eukprot:XP_004996840.1 hypothetical protein PTSG_02352 [Salpingoeca rosetta]
MFVGGLCCNSRTLLVVMEEGDDGGGGVLVTVVTPAHNEETRIERALASLLLETHRPLEVSIYDDASRDGTLNVVRRMIPRLHAAGIHTRVSCAKCFERRFGSRDGTRGGHCGTATLESDAGTGANAPAVGTTGKDAARRGSVATKDTTTVHHTAGEDDDMLRHVCSCQPASRELQPGGVGFAKNRAIQQSVGNVLCFLDADDYMENDRVASQLRVLLQHPDAIVGTQFRREPADSTERYTRWANALSDTELCTNRFKECTVLQPTWMVRRRVFDAVGGYKEGVLCEDLDFFYRHFDVFFANHDAASPVAFDRALCAHQRRHDDVRHANDEGTGTRCDGGDEHEEKRSKRQTNVTPLPIALLRTVSTVYTYRPSSACHRVSRALIRQVRAHALQRQVLRYPPWSSGFAIWGAGKNGRLLYKLLDPAVQAKVKYFADIDPKKVGGKYNDHGPNKKHLVRSIDIRGVEDLEPPFITCVAMDRGNAFETLLAKMGLTEGIDYYLFG